MVSSKWKSSPYYSRSCPHGLPITLGSVPEEISSQPISSSASSHSTVGTELLTVFQQQKISERKNVRQNQFNHLINGSCNPHVENIPTERVLHPVPPSNYSNPTKPAPHVSESAYLTADLHSGLGRHNDDRYTGLVMEQLSLYQVVALQAAAVVPSECSSSQSGQGDTCVSNVCSYKCPGQF